MGSGWRHAATSTTCFVVFELGAGWDTLRLLQFEWLPPILCSMIAGLGTLLNICRIDVLWAILAPERIDLSPW